MSRTVLACMQIMALKVKYSTTTTTPFHEQKLFVVSIAYWDRRCLPRSYIFSKAQLWHVPWTSLSYFLKHGFGTFL